MDRAGGMQEPGVLPAAGRAQGRWRRLDAAVVALAALVALALAPPVRADPPKDSAPSKDETPVPEQATGSWWWSWGDGVFGINFGGVAYGNGPGVQGSDKLVHQLRTVSGFHGIELKGPIDIVVKQGPVEKLTLHTDDNIAPLIDTTVVDGILRIGVQPGAAFRTRHRVGATVDVKQLGSIKILGSGDVTCAGLQSELLEITVRGSGDVRIDDLQSATLAVLVQGSGDVRLSGNAAKQGFVIEGSGDVDAEELNGHDVAVRIAGSGDADVWATDALTVDIAGSGDVHYHGQPALKKSLHGSGELVHK
jgi:hypothetical protein